VAHPHPEVWVGRKAQIVPYMEMRLLIFKSMLLFGAGPEFHAEKNKQKTNNGLWGDL